MAEPDAVRRKQRQAPLPPSPLSSPPSNQVSLIKLDWRFWKHPGRIYSGAGYSNYERLSSRHSSGIGCHVRGRILDFHSLSSGRNCGYSGEYLAVTSFSTRRYLLVNAALFIFFSICCAWVWNLNSTIVFHALQGAKSRRFDWDCRDRDRYLSYPARAISLKSFREGDFAL